MIFVEDGSDPRSTLALLLSKVGTRYLEILCPTIDFNPGSVGQIPVLSDAIRKVANPSRVLVQMGQSDWDAYETSWDFTTLPLIDPIHRLPSLKETYTHLRTRWQSKTEEMQRLEEDNNRIFIEAYGLKDEMTPEVPLEEITLTCNPAYRYGGKKNKVELEFMLLADTMREFVSYAVGCMFGRYSLDAPGLILANQGEGIAEYLARVPKPTFPPDADNVIPILNGEWFSDDIAVLFREFLRATFGEARFQENLTFIEEALGKDLRKYLVNDFFSDHVKRYRKRPIYWLVSSGRYRAFQCLIYLHRYNEGTLARIRTEYLIPLQGQITSRIEMIEGEKIKASSTSHRKKLQKEQDELKKQQVELLSFDERIKHFADKKISLDLDDGVKINYGKFGDLLAETKEITGGEDDE
jgi:type II restriction/modification system DNA methylase subunit YeeA